MRPCTRANKNPLDKNGYISDHHSTMMWRNFYWHFPRDDVFSGELGINWMWHNKQSRQTVAIFVSRIYGTE